MKVLFKIQNLFKHKGSSDYQLQDFRHMQTCHIEHITYVVYAEFDQEVAPSSMCKIGFSSDNNIVTFLVIYVYFNVM
jgi:hypothetical protein